MKHFDNLSSEGNYTYFPVVSSACDREILLEDGKKLVNFASCDYLGLANDSRLKDAAKEAINKFGTNISGAVVLSGYTYLHRNFESSLTLMFKGYNALMFTTSFLGNLGVIPMIVQQKDVIILDKLSHSCLIQGALLSKATIRVYRHNDMDHLEEILKEYKDKNIKKIVLTDGVFSTDGDIAPLVTLVSLCKRYNALSYIDDAHGVGTLGVNGCGLVEQSGVLGEVDFIFGTMSKAFGSTGGFFLTKNSSYHNIIRHICPAYTSSRAVSPGVVAASLASLEVNNQEGNMRRKTVNMLSKLMVSELQDKGFDTLYTETPIIPIVFKNPNITGHITKKLIDNGFLVAPFIPPYVENNKARLRIGVTYNHTVQDIMSFVHSLSEIVKTIKSQNE